MNLYLLTNDDHPNFDYYESIIVAELTIERAHMFRPENPMTQSEDHWPQFTRDVTIEQIGICEPDRPAGFIHGSFFNS